MTCTAFLAILMVSFFFSQRPPKSVLEVAFPFDHQLDFITEAVSKPSPRSDALAKFRSQTWDSASSHKLGGSYSACSDICMH